MMDRRKLREQHDRSLAFWAKHGKEITQLMRRIDRLEAIHNTGGMK